MTAVKISKDWMTTGLGAVRRHKFEQITVTKSEDLPELMTTKMAAEFLLRHPKTIEEYRKDGSLKFLKIRGRYFTTPEYIAQFLEIESRKK